MRFIVLEVLIRSCPGLIIQPKDLRGNRGWSKYVIWDERAAIRVVGKFAAFHRREGGRRRLAPNIFNSSMETRSPLEVPITWRLQNLGVPGSARWLHGAQPPLRWS